MGQGTTGRQDGLDTEVRWLHGPWLDLVVGCAAWSAPLILLADGASQAGTRAWGVAFYALALVLNYPHYMATVHRAYGQSRERDRYRAFTVHLTLLFAAVAVAAHAWPLLLPWIFTLYVTWSPWHYTGQNFGLLMLFARRNGTAPSARERWALYTAFASSYLLFFLSAHTGISGDPLVISLGLPAWLAAPARLVLLGVFAGVGGVAVLRIARRAGPQAAAAPLTLFLTQGLWFVLPSVQALLGGAQAPATRYSTGILAVMHSAQYLWITSHYARKEAASRAEGAWRPWSYAGILVLGGIALFVPTPWVASYLLGMEFTTSVLIVSAVVNLHHFMLDGAIWKLRDHRVASLLIGHGRRLAGALESAARPRPSRLGSWNPVTVLAVAALLLLAGVDQLRFVLASRVDDASALARATALNPHDGAARFRHARLLLQQGQYEDVLEVYQADPSNASEAEAMTKVVLAAVQADAGPEALERLGHLLPATPEARDAHRHLAQAWAALAYRLDRDGSHAAAGRALLQALAVDERQGDVTNIAVDWFNYGQFLRRQQADPRLVLACLTRATNLLGAAGDPRLPVMQRALADVARDHPDAAAAVQADIARWSLGARRLHE